MSRGGSLRSLCILGAIVSLGLGLQVNDGLYDPAAIALLIVTLCCTAASFWLPRRRISDRALIGSMLSAAIVLLGAGFYRAAGATHSFMPPDSQGPYHAGLFGAAIGLVAVCRKPRLAGFIGAYLLMIVAVIGVWKIRSAPDPLIDVYTFQTDGPRALLHGLNPYMITFPNLYGPDTTVYGPGMVRNGRLTFGYPYAPLNLYWVLPSVALFNDPRYAQLFALLLSGTLIWRAAGGTVGVLAMALLLFSPRTFYVIESAWTEPLSILLLSVVIGLYLRRSRWTWVLFGLFVASKQYLPITLLLIKHLSSSNLPEKGFGFWDRLQNKQDGRALFPSQGRETTMIALLIACAVAFVVSAPLVFWNLPAFIHSAITLQLHQPFREDAMSLLVPIARDWPHRDRAAVVAFLAAAGVAVAALRRRPGRAPAPARWLAAQLLLLFAFNKQAFANYYILVIAALVLALVEEFVQNRATPSDTELSDYGSPAPLHSPFDADGSAACPAR